MDMRFKLDQFYRDDSYGVIKFKGYADSGKLLFEQYEKGFVKSGRYSGWLKTSNVINIDQDFQSRRFKAGRIKEIPPPQ